MRGLEQVPAGCIVVPDRAIEDPAAFTAEASNCASESGASLLRFYTPAADDFPAFAAAGLRRSAELGFVAATRDDRPELHFAQARVLPVREQRDWDRKRDLAAALEQLPDGKQAAAAAWTELERRKCDAGFMEAFLIELDGEARGAFALASCGPLLRLKNLVVHPGTRRRGLARAAVGYAFGRAREAGFDWVGAFALAEGGGRALYERCGFSVVTGQVEWSGAIDADARHAARRTA